MIDSKGHIKLIDFGLAKVVEKKYEMRTRTNCGTLGYTAPEVIVGNVGYSFPADIWSYGVLMFELLTR